MSDNQRQRQEDDLFGSESPQNAYSRSHFSLMDPLQSRPRPNSQRTQPPLRHGSPLNPNKTPELRRRPLPSDAIDLSPRNRRLNLVPMTRMDSRHTNDPDVDVVVFSNEYDLAHEDPRILQDVQRALQLKARREARTRLETSAKVATSHQASPSSSHSKPPANSPVSSASVSPLRKSSHSTASEVDFSPSIGMFDFPTKLHPVPSSLDNGITLDWTGGVSHEGEWRWTKSIVKQKDKEILPPLGVMIEEQEQLHKEKLSRINALASTQTTRKAHITSEQLSRRYNLIYDTLKTKKPFNLVKVTKWYATQPEVGRQSLERAEPFTWLKHLEKRAGRSTRSLWNLTALIMEEYIQTQERDRLLTIPEDSALRPVVSYTRKSHSPSYLSQEPITDDRISFEPLAESKSKRSSWDAISLKSAESTPVSVRTNSSTPLPELKITTVQPMERVLLPRNTTSDESGDDYERKLIFDVPQVSVHPPTAQLHDNFSLDRITRPGGGSDDAKTSVSPISRSPASMPHSKSKHVTHEFNTTRPTRHRKKIREDRERQLREEYDAKSILLADAVHHNNKIRQLLNRISTNMKDYDILQNDAQDNIKSLLPDVPKQLIDAFGHDPAGVSSSTRRMHGWRAVEDVYNRIHRQRQIFKSFLENFEELLPNDLCPLDKPIETLEALLQILRTQKVEIDSDAETVSELLKNVHELHGRVKDEYNKTVSHVSVVYPELSYIVALEESYKDQYQQFWEIGMDALTLLLDTVTPFWRHYGKSIGEDVRDFLIVPLYRNEFTGEPKRYRINACPSRSFRHWLLLIVFFFCSIAINILQVRAAVSSTVNFRLSSIPYDGIRWTALPFFWISIIIQWFAVLLEFAVVFMELGVIAWWIGWTANLFT